MAEKIVISGIGTDVGKTVVSAILAEHLKASYWKPVQAGDLHFSDSMKVQSWCSEQVQVLPERYRLNTACSPHLAAELDGVFIQETDFILPETDRNLLIEGAGGLMVPINNEGLLYVDLIKSWNLPLVLVSRHYLGSINHTLLSLELLKKFDIQIKVLIWVGDENKATEEIVLNRFPNIRTHRIPLADNLNADFIREQAAKIPESLFNTSNQVV